MPELYEHTNLTSIAAYLHHLIDVSGKTQREIAKEVGFERQNMISMLKHGDTKVPLDKIPALARALDADPAHLLRLALEQYWPEWKKVINEIFGGVVSKNEITLLLAIRKATLDRDPEFSPSQIIAAVAALQVKFPAGISSSKARSSRSQ
jgi:transcriptional regulator with XRE-family HTH domain